MKIVILVRRCPTYSNFTEKTFKEQVDLPYAPVESILSFFENNILKIWNDFSFYTDFFTYRQTISDLAKQNLIETNCEIIWGLPRFESWFVTNKEDCFILPCSDEDWFDAKIFELAKETISDTTRVLLWKKTILHAITKMNFNICDGFSFKGNTWGIRFSYLKNLDYNTVESLLFSSNEKAESLIRNNIPKKNWKTIDKNLSVCVRHVGNLDFLNQLSSDTLIEDELPKISRREISSPDIPVDLEWTRKFVDNLYQINFKLRNA